MDGWGSGVKCVLPSPVRSVIYSNFPKLCIWVSHNLPSLTWCFFFLFVNCSFLNYQAVLIGTTCVHPSLSQNATHILVCSWREQDKGYRCSATCNPESSVVNSLGLKRHFCCQSLKCGFYSFIIGAESFHSHAVFLSPSLSFLSLWSVESQRCQWLVCVLASWKALPC